MVTEVEGVRVVLELDDKISMSVNKANEQLARFVADARRTADATQRLEKHATSLTARFRDVVQIGGMLRFVMYDIRDVFNATIGVTVRYSSEIQRMTKVMEGLSTATSQQAREQEALSGKEFVFNLSKNAPFEVQALTDSFIKFKSAGIDPTTGSMQALVDSVAKYGGTSEQLKRASVAIQQMAGKGVVSMEELRQQLGEAVPDAMRLMATGMGLSMAELAKTIKTGTVEATNAIGRMAYQMKLANGGAAKAMMETWQGQFEKFKANFAMFVNDVGTMGAEAGQGNNPAKDSFMGRLTDGIKELNAYLESNEGKKTAADLAIIMSDLARAVVVLAESFAKSAKYIIENWSTVVRLLETSVTVFAAFKGFNLFKQLQAGTASYIANFRAEMEKRKIIELEAMQSTLKTQAAAHEATISNLAAEKGAYAKQSAELSALRAKESAELLRQKAIEKRNLEGYNNAATKSTQALYLNRIQNARNAQVEINRALTEIDRADGNLARNMVANGVKSAQAKRSLAAATNSLSGAMTAVTAVGSTMMRGLGLLLGPLGLVLTAVSLGATAWELWGKNASQSLDDAIRKTKEYATEENLRALGTDTKQNQQNAKNLSGAIGDFEKNRGDSARIALDKAMGEAGVGRLERIGKDGDAMLAMAKKKLSEINSKLQEAGVTAANGTKQVIERNIQEGVDTYMARVQTTLDAYDRAYKQQQIERQKANPNEKPTEFNQWQKDARTSNLKAQIEIIAKDSEKVEILIGKAKAGTANYEMLVRERVALAEKATALNAEITNEVNKIGTQVFNTTADAGDAGKAPIVTKIQAYINKLKDKRTELVEEMKGVTDDTEKFINKLDRGAFNMVKKGGKKGPDIVTGPSAQEAVEALALEEQIDKLKTATGAYTAAEKSLGSALGNIDTRAGDITERYQMELSDLAAGVNTAKTEVAKFESDMKRTIEQTTLALNQRRQASILAYEANPTQDNRELVVSEGDVQKAIESVVNWLKQKRGELIAISNIDFMGRMRDQIQDINDELNPDKNEVARNRADTKIAEIKREYDARIEVARQAGQETILLEMQKEAAIEAMEKKRTRDTRTSFQIMMDDWANMTKQMSSNWENWANGAIDVLVEFVKTGKLEFSDLVDSILTDILRMQMKAAAADIYKGIFGGGMGGSDGGYDTLPTYVDSSSTKGGSWMDDLAGFFGFANGGIMTPNGAVELRKYASGGIANKPQLALYGEGSMNEAFVPLPDGRTIPVTMSGGGSPGVTVNVINNANGTQAREERSQNADGSMRIDVIIEQIEGTIAQNVSKGRGKLSGQLEKTYGLNRAAGAY